MPSYLYRCEECDTEIEITHSIKDEDVVKVCPECQSDKFKRLIAAGSSFVLIGGGWARDNYSKSS
jgi:putative FmdB family regulatory protein